MHYRSASLEPYGLKNISLRFWKVICFNKTCLFSKSCGPEAVTFGGSIPFGRADEPFRLFYKTHRTFFGQGEKTNHSFTLPQSSLAFRPRLAVAAAVHVDVAAMILGFCMLFSSRQFVKRITHECAPFE